MLLLLVNNTFYIYKVNNIKPLATKEVVDTKSSFLQACNSLLISCKRI